MIRLNLVIFVLLLATIEESFAEAFDDSDFNLEYDRVVRIYDDRGAMALLEYHASHPESVAANLLLGQVTFFAPDVDVQGVRDAIAYFENVEREGYLPAKFYLGQAYLTLGLEEGSHDSFVMAHQFLKGAYNNGIREASYHLGLECMLGVVVEKDFVCAFDYFMESSELDNTRALANAGAIEILELSRFKQGMDKVRRATELSELPEAELFLAYFGYFGGLGEQERQFARQTVEELWSNDFNDASALGVTIGLMENDDEYFKVWLDRDLERGNAGAIYRQAVYGLPVDATESDFSDMVSRLRISAERGYAAASFELSFGYYFGKFNLQEDRVKAQEILSALCLSGEKYACDTLEALDDEETAYDTFAHYIEAYRAMSWNEVQRFLAAIIYYYA